MIRLTLIFLISSLACLGCRDNNHPADKAFKEYMTITLGAKIAPGLHYYVLVPSNQCVGCIRWDAKLLSGKQLAGNTTVISSARKSVFKNFDHYVNDKGDDMLALRFLHYRNTIIVVNAGHVVASVHVNNLPQQLDSLQQIFAVSPSR